MCYLIALLKQVLTREFSSTHPHLKELEYPNLDPLKIGLNGLARLALGLKHFYIILFSI